MNPVCRADNGPLVHDTLYFGHNIPGGGTVDAQQWRDFLAEVITPRFPRGFTVIEGNGQWQGENGKIERERSGVVTILHNNDIESTAALSEITAEYKRRFNQEAVLRESAAACVRFD